MSRRLRVLVVGGLERLDAHYRDVPGDELAIELAYLDSAALEGRALAADAIVLVTGHVSHAAAEKVRLVARRRRVPLVPATSPSLSRVRAAIATAFVAARTTLLCDAS